MENIYYELNRYYSKYTEQEPIIQLEWVEGYFRLKAWNGYTDKQLKEMWQHLQFFEFYLSSAKIRDIEKLNIDDYLHAVNWLIKKCPGFKRSLKFVKSFFIVIKDFFSYLISKKIITTMTELEKSSNVIAGEKLNLKYADLKCHISPFKPDVGFKNLDELNAFIDVYEKLYFRLTQYYQADSFQKDIHRALFLYTGPLGADTISNINEHTGFWLGFWDYFLFDYHLIETDMHPLDYYLLHESWRHSASEQDAMRQLIGTRFAIFYVTGVCFWGGLKCVNLFTDEVFYWPFPDSDYARVDKLLFYGHILANDIVVVTYITGLEISSRLRKRIKEEILRQKELYSMQEPNADWFDFFERHALTVRHTLNVFAFFNKVNVTPFNQIGRKFPTVLCENTPDKNVNRILIKSMRMNGFSQHDIELAQKIWFDYCQFEAGLKHNPESWAAAVIYVFTHTNVLRKLSAGSLSEWLNVSTNSIYYNQKKIRCTLDIKKYDPRYMSEEGFMFSLFQV